jgi:hypothetical protein
MASTSLAVKVLSCGSVPYPLEGRDILSWTVGVSVDINYFLFLVR